MTPVPPDMSYESLLQAATELITDSGLPSLLTVIIVFSIIGIAQMLIRKLKAVAGDEYEKSKNEMPWEREARKQTAWTLYHGGYELTPEQRALLRLPEDDDKPKRQTYMTIGDDGELVEMDE